MEKIIAKIIEEIIDNMSPEIRQRIIDFLDHFEEEAKKTPNPWDDLAVKIAKAVIGN